VVGTEVIFGMKLSTRDVSIFGCRSKEIVDLTQRKSASQQFLYFHCRNSTHSRLDCEQNVRPLHT